MINFEGLATHSNFLSLQLSKTYSPISSISFNTLERYKLTYQFRIQKTSVLRLMLWEKSFHDSQPYLLDASSFLDSVKQDVIGRVIIEPYGSQRLQLEIWLQPSCEEILPKDPLNNWCDKWRGSIPHRFCIGRSAASWGDLERPHAL